MNIIFCGTDSTEKREKTTYLASHICANQFRNLLFVAVLRETCCNSAS